MLIAFLVVSCGTAGASDALTAAGGGYTGGAANEIVDGSVLPVDAATVACPALANLDDLADGNYDGVVTSGGLMFAERFSGQNLTYSETFDVLSGMPSSPLSLQAGSAGQNLAVYDYYSTIILGVGPLGYPDSDAPRGRIHRRPVPLSAG